MVALVGVAAAIGKTITWLLDSYKRTLDIKKARDEAQNLGMPKEVMQAYKDRADEVIEKAIKERVKQLMLMYKGPKERGKEMEAALKWAMESLVYKIERGLRVEVRYLPPPVVTAAEDKTTNEERKIYAELAEIQARLLYPEIRGEPILQLPPAEPPKTKKPRKPRADKKPNGGVPVEVIAAE